MTDPSPLSSRISGTTRLVGVIGWPVEHSLSPPMQNAAIEALGLDWVYVAMPVAPENLSLAIAGARALGFIGLNVTLPHKQAIPALIDRLDPLARALGVVNTIHFTDAGAIGYTTDPLGYTRTVEEETRELASPNHSAGAFSFRNATVLQVGAGGVGRAMAAGAAQAGAARVFVAARRLAQAEELAAALEPHFPDTIFSPLDLADHGALRVALSESGLIANATSLGMRAADALPIPVSFLDSLRPGQVVFDTVYTPAETALLGEARKRGLVGIGGLGMLMRQGSASLAIWSGLQPDEALMQRTLRDALARRNR